MNKKGFSLAEMMVVLLILSIVLAASLPIITKRSKISSSSAIWQYTSDMNNIYYGSGDVNGAIIGAEELGTVSSNPRLMLNAANANQTQIIFKEAGNEYGQLVVNSSNNVGLGSVIFGSGIVNSTAIGSFANVSASYSIALGNNANVSASRSIALGNNAMLAVGIV